MLELIIKMLINFLCGAIVMVLHELPKYLTATIVTHPMYRKKKLHIPSPTKFVDPIGLILFGFSSFGVGWQKPYEYSPNKLKDKEKSLIPIMMTGQLVTLACVIGFLPLFFVFQQMGLSPYLLYAIITMVKFSMVIFIVNLLPVPPFDMAKIIYAFSPNSYFSLMQNERYIHTAFIMLVAFGIVERLAGQLLVPFLNYFF